LEISLQELTVMKQKGGKNQKFGVLCEVIIRVQKFIGKLEILVSRKASKNKNLKKSGELPNYRSDN